MKAGRPESAGQNWHGVRGEASIELWRGQVLYGVRSSDPLRPRAMPRRPVMAWGSVSRGVHRRSIELRNHRSGVPTLLDDGEGNMEGNKGTTLNN